MTRRGFLRLLGIGGIGLVLAPIVPVSCPSRSGISMRFVRAFDARTDRMPARLDVLYGMATLRPGLAARVLA